MSWSIGFDEKWQRDIGYGVPAFCDHPGCVKRIDRGLAYVCGGEPYGGVDGCGLYFCESHLYLPNSTGQQCRQCFDGNGSDPFPAKPDHPEWVQFKAADPSWEEWRKTQATHDD